MSSKLNVRLTFSVLLIIFCYALYMFATTIGAQHPVSNSSPVVVQDTRSYHPDSRTQESDCHVNGPFPDHDCTPGAVFPDATPETICVMGYTKTVRNVSTSLKKKMYAEYGLSYPQARGAYEADHLISLELGGSNDIANLFPEAAEPKPGFHEKDLVENYLHQELCSGRMGLAEVQRKISTDWLSVYKSLTPTQLEELMNAFRY